MSFSGDRWSAGRALSEVNRLIDLRRVEMAFQPIVHIPTKEVVGYEAFARGPEGTSIESPIALLAAAREAGRLAELDWLCAASACSAAQTAGLRPSTSIFLNFEPTTLLTSCPEDLLGLNRRAQDQLRLFVELKEDRLLDGPGRFLDALARVRDVGWGVAVDRASASSLVLFPLIDPDVVELDLRQVRGDPAAVGAMSDDARLYAEQAGARLLAQGAEGPDDVALARVAGAEFGQGWYFGRPGSLMQRGGAHATRNVIPLLQRGSPTVGSTPLETVAPFVPPAVAERRFLQPLATYLLTQAEDVQPSALLLVSLERRSAPDDRASAALARAVDRAAFAVVFGSTLDGAGRARARFPRLEPTSPMVDDWSIVLLGPHLAGALLARDLGDDGPLPYRRYEYVVTHHRDLVRLAACSLLRWDRGAERAL